ncbi:MAG TPA: hypothetical protein PLV66_11335 [Thermoanaerobaculales bacterium]|nr:hypothetical protein [Thermoanaerobaculales bacterium]
MLITAAISTGSSPLARSRLRYLGLFAASVPAWWLFELLNQRTRNWIYLSEPIGDLEYALLASLSFSTVMPAVFGTAELVASLGWLRRLPAGPRIAATRRTTATFLVSGLAMLGLLLLWPRVFFPCVWLSVYFILEPLNAWLGRRTLLDDTGRGDWRRVVALWTGCLVCGFFWEMWNSLSYPKWIYDVPFVGFGKLFEMPVLGYGGYLPFSLELYALYHLLAGVAGRGREAYVLPPSVWSPQDESR